MTQAATPATSSPGISPANSAPIPAIGVLNSVSEILATLTSVISLVDPAAAPGLEAVSAGIGAASTALQTVLTQLSQTSPSSGEVSAAEQSTENAIAADDASLAAEQSASTPA